MNPPERQFIDSLIRSLLKKRGVIDFQLKRAQKYERKLVKGLQRNQRQQNNGTGEEASAQLTQYKEEIDKQVSIKTQLRERLSTIEFKLAKLNRRQII